MMIILGNITSLETKKIHNYRRLKGYICTTSFVENNAHIITVVVDLSKAFDTLDHKILIPN